MWAADERLPAATLRTALTRFLDVAAPPSPVLLQQLASLATDENDRNKLLNLAAVSMIWFRRNKKIIPITVRMIRHISYLEYTLSTQLGPLVITSSYVVWVTNN